jgi:hypothetical protein
VIESTVRLSALKTSILAGEGLVRVERGAITVLAPELLVLRANQ